HLQRVQAARYVVEPAKRGAQQALDGLPRFRRYDLRQVANVNRPGRDDFAAIRLDLTGQDAQQRGLADAVGADQRQLVGFVDDERDVAQDERGAETLGNVRNG